MCLGLDDTLNSYGVLASHLSHAINMELLRKSSKKPLFFDGRLSPWYMLASASSGTPNGVTVFSTTAGMALAKLD